MTQYKLTENLLDELKLPDIIDDNWKAPDGYFLEGFTDEIQMWCTNGLHPDELVASWHYIGDTDDPTP